MHNEPNEEKLLLYVRGVVCMYFEHGIVFVCHLR